MTRVLAVLSAVTWFAVLMSTESVATRESQQRPNFAADIAAILYANCLVCHRPNGVAPFSLVSYEDVQSRGKEVLTAVTSGHMPPWSATTPPGFPELQHDPRLTPRQIATLSQWIAIGMPAGEGARTPPPPPFRSGWLLGVPDLTVSLPRPISIPADTKERVFNVVFRMNDDTDRWITAVDYQPTARAILSHAMVFAVPATMPVDPDDPLPGFGGLLGAGSPTRISDELVLANRSVETLGVWVPGGLPRPTPDGAALRLPRGTDIVMQFRARAADTGAIEDGTLALYFSKTAPGMTLGSVQLPPVFGLASRLNVPVGSATAVLKDEFTLPIDITALGGRGHGPDFAKDMKMTARLPNGSTRNLLWINRWDMNHQETYYFTSPVRLPKGTTVIVEITHAPDPRLASELGSMSLVIAAPSGADATALANSRERHLRDHLLKSIK